MYETGKSHESDEIRHLILRILPTIIIYTACPLSSLFGEPAATLDVKLKMMPVRFSLWPTFGRKPHRSSSLSCHFPVSYIVFSLINSHQRR